MRIKLFIVGAIVAILCVLGVAATSNSDAQAPITASGRQTKQASAPLASRSVGITAIQPTLSENSSPRFTTADVRAYLKTHPFMSGPPVQGATPKIVEIKFMTSKQASALMQGESVGLPDAAIVCYVQFHGPFTQVNASIPPGAKPLPPANTGVEIFDGQTGNLLMWWTP